MLPDGLVYLDSWLEAEGDRCFQLMESADPALLEQWSRHWRDLVSFEFVELASATPDRAPERGTAASPLPPLNVELVREAAARIRPYVVRTPLLRHAPNSDCELLLKPESLQPTGAFKLRGAFNLMCTLPRDCAGVVAHSSGNHAQAVAYAARELGMKAIIVMPNDAPAIKRERTEALGAEVVEVGPDSGERAQRAAELAQQRGLFEVPPFDHPLVAAGQGTAALELCEDVNALERSAPAKHAPARRFYAPISGGGLMAGCAVAVRASWPEAEIVGCEPEGADDARRSLLAGERVSVPAPQTIADGLRVRMLGELTWPVIRDHVARIEVVSDAEMLNAMAYALHRLRLVVEPSGACSLAVALREARRVEEPGHRFGVVLSGGNVAPELLAEVARRSDLV
jgi:threonine dehydratase